MERKIRGRNSGSAVNKELKKEADSIGETDISFSDDPDVTFDHPKKYHHHSFNYVPYLGLRR